MGSLEKLQKKISECERCPRLRKYCQKIARERRKAFIDQEYWGRPVPSFGDSKAKIMIVGLAPGAHGANRTGRMFTGDQSGLWLYRALAKAGFANRVGEQQFPDQACRQDGLKLKDAWITNVVHCAPPDNKPNLNEIEECAEYLKAEIHELSHVVVFIALGQIALKGLWKSIPEAWKRNQTMPRFSHGARIPLSENRIILCSYHPSQQNTFTKKLTEPMLDQVFDDARKVLNKTY